MSAAADARTILLRERESVSRPRRAPGATVVKWVTTTDHKVIGNLYFITSFAWFLMGGVMALIIRAELIQPGMQVVDNPDQFNQLFTMHGSIMLLLFATPLFAAFANALVPLQIGAPDVSFPRLNMFAYWLYLFGGLTMAGGSSPPAARPPSVGSPTPRSRQRLTAPAWAATFGSSAWPSPDSGRSSARSTSSRRS
jgi:cytochrome c oxidase subunit 1